MGLIATDISVLSTPQYDEVGTAVANAQMTIDNHIETEKASAMAELNAQRATAENSILDKIKQLTQSRQAAESAVAGAQTAAAQNLASQNDIQSGLTALQEQQGQVAAQQQQFILIIVAAIATFFIFKRKSR